MPVISEKDSLLVRCTCHGHVLEVRNDDEWINDGIEPSIEVSVWNQTPAPYSFKQRLFMIWTLLKGKNLEGGDVIITNDDAAKMIRFLSKSIRKNRANWIRYKARKHAEQKKKD